MTGTGKKRRRGWWKWAGAGVLLLLISASVSLWMMFHSIPEWYRPVEIAPEQMQSVRDDMVRTTSGFDLQMARANRPFEYTITQDQLNAWLAAREDIWPMSRKWLPKEISEPFIQISPQGVRLAATGRYGGLQCVISTIVRLEIRPEGIYIELDDIYGGSLVSPRGMIQEKLILLDQNGWPAGQRSEFQFGPGTLPALAELYEGVLFPNGWIWPKKPKRPFRIADLELQEGVAVITIDPLPRDLLVQSGPR